MKGITKAKQVVGKKAQQVLQILVRQPEREHIQTSSFIYKKSKSSEKGFCLIDVVFHNKKIGFISTHLSSDNENAKKEAFKKILAVLKNRIGGIRNNRYDALFMMGDLNYRFYQTHKVKNDNIKREGKADTAWILNQMLSRAGRNYLMENYDSFHADEVTRILKVLPIKWLDYHPDTLPTYKKNKNIDTVKALLRDLERIWNKNDGHFTDDKRARQLLGRIYTTEGKFKEKKGRQGLWDAGYLDRIGYALLKKDENNGQLVQYDLLKDGLSAVRAGHDEAFKMFGANFVPFGDHSMVYSIFKLNGF